VFILAIIGLFTGGAFALFAWRAPLLRQGSQFALVSREGSLVFNNLVLVVICAAVLVGTLYPLALETLGGDKISVGAPYFNAVFIPMTLVLLALLPLGPFLPWKRASLADAARRLAIPALLAVVAMGTAYVTMPGGSIRAAFGFGIGVWLIGGALAETAFRIKAFMAPWDEVRRRAVNLPRASYGTMIAHLGLGVSVVGVVATSAWGVEQIRAIQPGETVPFAGYEVRFETSSARQGPNYRETIGTFQLTRGGALIETLTPSKRQYVAPPTATTEAAIHATWLGSNVYVVIGYNEGAAATAGVPVRLYYHPLARWIWIGSFIMFFGGLFSLSDRRLRVGAPSRRAVPASAAPAGGGS
jgi:cytochrome c-type biogenesis protein CcmF